jgi:hypothetical protein
VICGSIGPIALCLPIIISSHAHEIIVAADIAFCGIIALMWSNLDLRCLFRSFRLPVPIDSVQLRTHSEAGVDILLFLVGLSQFCFCLSQ